MTQGDPLFPTIFNMVVDVVVRHWMTVVIAGEEERGQEGRHQAAIFYADDGMVASSDPHWLQGSFNTLVGLFDWVGMRTNVRNTFDMVCCPCQAVGNQLEEVYGSPITGEGLTYRERQKGWVHCREYRNKMAEGSMASHMMTKHGSVAESQRSWKASSTRKIRGHIEWPSWPREARGAARWRDARAEQR